MSEVVPLIDGNNLAGAARDAIELAASGARLGPGTHRVEVGFRRSAADRWWLASAYVCVDTEGLELLSLQVEPQDVAAQ